jgi:hypothetical protein
LPKKKSLPEKILWDLQHLYYLSSIKTGEIITQSDIARPAGLTEVTVRNRAHQQGSFFSDRLEIVNMVVEYLILYYSYNQIPLFYN